MSIARMTLLLKSQCSAFAYDPADIIEVSDLLDARFHIFRPAASQQASKQADHQAS